MVGLQVFYGSDGTRTRDLRRDRPVVVIPGRAGVSGDFRHEQDFSPPACGDYRAPARASGDLPRDVRGMERCLSWRRRDVCGVRRFLAPLQGEKLELVTQHKQLDVLYMQAAAATDKRAKQSPESEVEKEEPRPRSPRPCPN
jgi:hypothetical protein